MKKANASPAKMRKAPVAVSTKSNRTLMVEKLQSSLKNALIKKINKKKSEIVQRGQVQAAFPLMNITKLGEGPKQTKNFYKFDKINTIIEQFEQESESNDSSSEERTRTRNRDGYLTSRSIIKGSFQETNQESEFKVRS